MQFWLGSHQPHWLARTDVGLMVSHRRLAGRKTFPRATGAWVLDSGGFTELNLHGEWTVAPDEYVAAVRRYEEEIGGLAWAAPQDWMCEPFVLAKTGLTVVEHQRRTIDNYLELRDRGPFIPVLQGWTRADYAAHVEQYETAGVDLRQLPLVGLGSICRRAATSEIVQLVDDLVGYGLSLHGFGVKRESLPETAHLLASADSMAWSYRARRAGQQDGCSHKSCVNCLTFALRWRSETLARVDAQHPRLWGAVA